MPSLFKIEQQELNPHASEIEVKGELDLAVMDQLEAAIAQAEAEGRNLLVNLSDCGFIDSSGLATIVRAHQRFAENGKVLLICCPEAQVERILKLTGLDREGLLVQTREEALPVLL
jgi:anti-sigma B factor antagonist